MFTDMVGYSSLSQRNEALALQLLEEHRSLLRALFPRFNGREVKTIGDAFLVEFHSALEAAQCAIEIHIGDVVQRADGDVLGGGVNIASRIEPLAGANGICISVDVERQIRNTIETSLMKLGPTELKNIQVPMELFRIVLPWEKGERSSVERGAAERGERRRRPLVLATIVFLCWLASVVGSSSSGTGQRRGPPGRPGSSGWLSCRSRLTQATRTRIFLSMAWPIFSTGSYRKLAGCK